jgi:UDP-glucuronate decarboxylase
LNKEVKFYQLFNTSDDEILNLDYSSNDDKSILITGSRGMIGGALAATLAKLLDNQSLKCELFLASRTWEGSEKFFQAKRIKLISNTEARSGNTHFDSIIHCASPSNITKIERLEELSDINTGFLRDCISAITTKVVFISTGEVYGGNLTSTTAIPPSLNNQIRRHWYPIAKLETEQFLKEKTENTNLSVDTVRLFHSFGPGLSPHDGRSFADIIYSAAISKEITLKSNGQQTRSFLYLSDAVAAILLSLLRRNVYQVTNVGSPEGATILSFANLVAEITGSVVNHSNPEFEHSPFDIVVPDITETVKLGWSPKVSLPDAISATLSWIKS